MMLGGYRPASAFKAFLPNQGDRSKKRFFWRMSVFFAVLATKKTWRLRAGIRDIETYVLSAGFIAEFSAETAGGPSFTPEVAQNAASSIRPQNFYPGRCSKSTWGYYYTEIFCRAVKKIWQIPGEDYSARSRHFQPGPHNISDQTRDVKSLVTWASRPGTGRTATPKAFQLWTKNRGTSPLCSSFGHFMPDDFDRGRHSFATDEADNILSIMNAKALLK